MPPLYLDNAATTPVRGVAREAMAPHLDDGFGNPSGLHSVSRRAKNAVEEAREQAAALVGAAHPLEIVFTGGGSESDNLAIKGAALAHSARGGVVVSAVEHEAVLASAGFVESLGCRLDVVGVDAQGVVDPAAVADAVEAGTAVVSIMAANNETGVTQAVRKIGDEARAVNGAISVHSDAVQAFISSDVTVDELGVDMLTLSAHKFGGPQGVGLLFVRDGTALEPAVHGGGQELGRRSGTHNVAGIVGMAAAMAEAAAERDSFRSRIGAMRDRFEAELARLLPAVAFTVPNADRLVQHSHFRVPGILAETLLIKLDGAGIAAAAGAACHSGAIEPSHVLSAMGIEPQLAAECVRVSFGWANADRDGEAAAAAIAEAVS